MKIFIVEDDIKLNEAIFITFSSLGYEVTTYSDGKDAFENLDDSYDLYMVDINLPNVNGIELVKQIKKINKEANIFIMSADINIETIIKAYDIGCTDYIKKPFDIREIIAKIKHTLSVVPQNIKIRDCGEYNKEERIFIVAQTAQEVKLTLKEAALLEVLLKSANKTVSNEKIESHVWGESIKNNHVRQLVSKLRNKIPCDFIENHTSNGYRIVL
jgi:DNA-binding response OmpR family regulator